VIIPVNTKMKIVVLYLSYNAEFEIILKTQRIKSYKLELNE
jgi:hypothetical protein